MTLWEDLMVPAFWQRRYYDFKVFRERKRVEKLRYIHRNPVKRGLVASLQLWLWSSYRFYALGSGEDRQVHAFTLCLRWDTGTPHRIPPFLRS